ncbi:MAG TPA: chloride channel protein [Polyangia bacterium]|nr:chloride channel protein [Polyangia bacterium]
MSEHQSRDSSTTEGLPVAPSLGPTLEELRLPRQRAAVDGRVMYLCALAIVLAAAAALTAQVLTRLIALVTHLAFYGRLSSEPVTPAGHHLGPWVILVPVLGGAIVGLMARYGSQAIRGHGIPEAMQQVLLARSRIPARVTLLKPLSAAISIGTGGPFGAEGPIVASGGALGSLLGQLLGVTADERKTLLAAGAAAGMTAIFGSPVAAVLLAVELLLFELRPRSLIPVALACTVATGIRIAFVGGAPVFPIPEVMAPGGGALAVYITIGALVGVAAVGATKAVYAVEDAFDRLPIHWAFWPALGGLAVGLVGLVVPRTLGVGYDNIEQILGGTLVGRAMLILIVAKFVSWAIALGSGTSGGTLAPLFTLGGGLGALLGTALAGLAPHLGVDPRIGALVGMAAMFAGASRALLASVIFAFETTRQPLGLLPLLGGCSAAYLVSCRLMRHSIMTEKMARRGVRVLTEYVVDYLDQVLARDAASSEVVTLRADQTVAETRAWLESRVAGSQHQGFPLLDRNGTLVGVLTRRDLLSQDAAVTQRLRELVRRPSAVVFEDSSLREAADLMVSEGIGRLPVLTRDAPSRLVGILSRSDLLAAHRRRLEEAEHIEEGVLPVGRLRRRPSPTPRPGVEATGG